MISFYCCWDEFVYFYADDFFFYQLQFSWFRGCSRIRGSWKARELISGEVVLLCLAILDWNYRKEKKVCTLFCPSPWKREVAMSGHCHLLGNSSIAEVWMGLGILIRNHKEVFPYLTSETDPALTSSSNLSWHWNKVLNLFFFLNCPVACRILVPQPRIELLPSAVEVQSLNHWQGCLFSLFLINCIPLNLALNYNFSQICIPT